MSRYYKRSPISKILPGEIVTGMDSDTGEIVTGMDSDIGGISSSDTGESNQNNTNNDQPNWRVYIPWIIAGGVAILLIWMTRK